MARLFVLSGASIGATHDIEGTTLLGRGVDADVVISEPSISRRHARLIPEPEPGVWKIRDLKSSNGVHVGGKRVEEALVRHGDTFLLGEVELRLRDEPGVDESPAMSDRISEAPPELEFEDEIELSAAAPQAPAEAGTPLARAADADDQDRLRESRERAARERAASERAARRAAALEGSAAAAPARGAARPAGTGGQVLQYAQHRRGDDLGQLPGWKRALLGLLAVGLAAGVAYGAFELTRTARAQSAAIGD